MIASPNPNTANGREKGRLNISPRQIHEIYDKGSNTNTIGKNTIYHKKIHGYRNTAKHPFIGSKNILGQVLAAKRSNAPSLFKSDVRLHSQVIQQAVQ